MKAPSRFPERSRTRDGPSRTLLKEATVRLHRFPVPSKDASQENPQTVKRWGDTARSNGLVRFFTCGRRYMVYAARGAAPGETRDDGTIAPTAAASSIPFTPRISIAAI